jgi:phage baseplate assembly protein W
MSYGISPVIPLQKNEEDGFYALTKTIVQNVKQNFKNLLLTAQGERVMQPAFGVGLKHFLFENNSFELQSEISDQINSQTKKYMPFISIKEIQIFEEEDPLKIQFNNILSIRIFYSVPSRGIVDIIDIL